MKRTPLRSMSAKRKAKLHQPAVPREPKPMSLSPSSRKGVYGGSTSGKAIEKEQPARSEAYRRLVAAMPCAMCSAAAPSQAAHANTGKGLSLKTDDRTCFPLCPPCHRDFDQGGMSRENRRVLEALYGQRTRTAILAAGAWPKNLPMWKEE